MPDQEAGTKRQVLSALCSLAGVLAVGSYTRHSSEGTELQGGPSRSQNTETWAGGTGLQRRTWGLIKRRGRARGAWGDKGCPGFSQTTLVADRPRGTHSPYTDCINSRIKELFAVQADRGRPKLSEAGESSGLGGTVHQGC